VKTSLFKKVVLLLSIISLVTFFLVQLLQTHTDPVFTKYSDYIFSDYGYLVSITLLSMSLAQLIITSLISKRYRLLSMIFLVSTIGAFIGTFFPTTVIKDLNPQRIIHTTGAATSFLFLPLGFYLLSKEKTNQDTSKLFSSLSLISITIFFIMFIYVIAGLDNKISYFGLIEKTNMLILQFLILAWSLQKEI